MIVIISRENDFDTIEVIQWLEYYNMAFTRINNFTQLSNFCSGLILQNAKSHMACWFRKPPDLEIEKITNSSLAPEEITFLIEERKALASGMLQLINQAGSRNIGSCELNEPSKMLQLIEAGRAGLLTPKSTVVNKRSDIFSFLKSIKSNVFISKYLSNSPYFVKDYTVTKSYTAMFVRSDLEDLSPFFPTSFIQEALLPKFDFRAIYFESKFYAVLIRDESVIDIRASQNKNIIPVQLAKQTEFNLKRLMDKFNLTYAAIDLALYKQQTYFLEINPFGQFGFVSKIGNYHIHKKIAEWLIN